jgi:hypothetical protein
MRPFRREGPCLSPGKTQGKVVLHLFRARSRHRLAFGLLAASTALLAGMTSTASGSAPIGTGKTIVFGLTRSGTAGAAAGACGSRLQCFKSAIT